MSHRKVYSQGSIPFSWEDKPGVSKVATLQGRPIDACLQALNLGSLPPPVPAAPSPSHQPRKQEGSGEDDIKIPLPPCRMQPPRRSSSIKGFRLQKDPFFVAYKECTKSVGDGKLPCESKKRDGSRVRRNRFFNISCKKSIEVVDDDSFARLSRLPPLPQDRICKGRGSE